MGKKQGAQRTRSEKLVSFDEAAKHAAENNGNLPDGVRVESPYGRSQIDAGSMAMTDGDVAPGGKAAGGATGDDGNTGSPRS